MSSSHKSLAVLLGGAVLATATGWAGDTATVTPAGQARMPAGDLAIWRDIGTGNGWLAHYKPTTKAGYYKIGATPGAARIAGWTLAVTPAGQALPAGSGTAGTGAAIYAAKCAMCHGAFGEGDDNYPPLAGGTGSLAGPGPEKTVGSYWPYATTLWDYINRAMPFYAPHTLTPDEVYALTAYILNLNGITETAWVADAASVPLVAMPNRNSFTWQDPRPVTHNVACMKNCATPSAIRITSNAMTMNLTPRLTGPVDDMKGGK